MNDSCLFGHEIAEVIAAIAALIAAYSSLKNGRTLKRNSNGQGPSPSADVQKAKLRPPKKPASNVDDDDWFRPPDLG